MKLYMRSLHGPTDWGWINEQIPILRVEDTSGLMGIDLETNTTVGACVLDNWTKNSCQAHLMVSSSMVFRHDFLQECAEYLFDVAKVTYVYGLVPANNYKALKLNKRIGFRERLRLPEAWDDGIDYVILEMTRETCTVLPKTKPEIEVIKEVNICG